MKITIKSIFSYRDMKTIGIKGFVKAANGNVEFLIRYDTKISKFYEEDKNSIAFKGDFKKALNEYFLTDSTHQRWFINFKQKLK